VAEKRSLSSQPDNEAGTPPDGAQNAYVDSEASHQASSNQNEERFTIMGIVGFVPGMELEAALRTTTWRYRPRAFGTQTELNAACAVASQVDGRTIVPGGPNQHVRDEHLTVFIVHTVSGLVGSRLDVTDNLVHIQYATDNVQDTSLTPSLLTASRSPISTSVYTGRTLEPSLMYQTPVSIQPTRRRYRPRSASPWTTSSETR